MTIKIAIVGVGKIARDQHLPTLMASGDFALAAAVNRSGAVPGLPTWPSLDAFLADGPTVDAISICTPPVGRHLIAAQALGAGLHVMLEKPPGATVSEVEPLIAAARAGKRSLYASWHSRAAPAVAPARAWLTGKAIRSVEINWLEDVRRWHPGQRWIWEAGGLGVFDPGINALSILTAILPDAPFIEEAQLHFPAGRAAPIAASLALRDGKGSPMRAEFDWRQTGEQRWEIAVETDAGLLRIEAGGARLTIAGDRLIDGTADEYAGLYRRFAELIGSGRSDVDLAPLKLVADAFMIGRRHEVEAFIDQPA